MSSDLSDFTAVRDYLYSLKNHGAKYGIDRMRLLSERLGHPERCYPVIHLAGTNGKGSTAAMLESILRTAGWRTGLFTSPHLVYQGERVQVDREILSHEAIVRYTQRLRVVAEAMAAVDPEDHPSFFEFMTGMAFLHFAAAEVDVAVIETGLGGRLDATNVVRPAVTVITSIGLDHQELLGNSLEAIAAEKAGILKAGVPVVMGLLPKVAEAVVRARAAELGCPLYAVEDEFGPDLAHYPTSALVGDYQRINAATAALTCRVLTDRFALSGAVIARGLATVSWAGRWDRREIAGRTVIFDATHNADGAAFLAENLRRLTLEQGIRPYIVAGTLGATRAASLMPVVAEAARELFLVRPAQPRACDFGELEAALPATATCRVQRSRVADLFPAPEQIAIGEPGDCIVVTGSIYLLGEVLDALHHSVPVGEGILQD